MDFDLLTVYARSVATGPNTLSVSLSQPLRRLCGASRSLAETQPWRKGRLFIKHRVRDQPWLIFLRKIAETAARFVIRLSASDDFRQHDVIIRQMVAVNHQTRTVLLWHLNSSTESFTFGAFDVKFDEIHPRKA